jgi:hypothetical protein
MPLTFDSLGMMTTAPFDAGFGSVLIAAVAATAEDAMTVMTNAERNK